MDIVPASAPLAAFAAQSHEDTENLPQSEADADFSWVDARLSYRYPHDAQTHLVSKISVTALMQDAPAAYTPLEPLSFSPQPAGAFSAAEVGTLVHRAMCKLDVAGAQSRDALTRQLDEMTARGIFTAQQRAALPLPMLLRFAISPMGQRLSQSRRVLREQPFNVQVPATLLEPSAPGDAFTLLQGILDCAFWEDDGWVLLDYKTNRIPPNGPQALIDTYRTQLDLYRYALGTLTSAPVRACYLCLLRSGDALSVAPGATFEVLAKGKASG